ncbi:MAG: hypothetical protein ACRCWF_08885 [Beijerinckiaceae bacterium]
MIWTRIAAVLMGATIFLHIFGGGPSVHEPLQAAVASPVLAAFAAVFWHFITVVLAILAVGLWNLSRRDDLFLEFILSGIQIGLAALFLAYGFSRLGEPWSMPQWVIFLTIPALTRFGQSKRTIP